MKVKTIEAVEEKISRSLGVGGKGEISLASFSYLRVPAKYLSYVRAAFVEEKKSSVPVNDHCKFALMMICVESNEYKNVSGKKK